jgi:quinol monooxygenase YgiN
MSAITLRVRLQARAGAEAEFERWASEVCAAAGSETGTTGFAYYRDERDGSYVALETYESSEAVLAHLENFAGASELVGRLGGLVERTGDRLEVYGDPSPEVREAYAPYRPVFFGIAASRD